MINQNQKPQNRIARFNPLFYNLARQDYSFYVEFTNNHRYTHAPHTLLICDYLQKVAEKKISRLIINIPPRHSKSMTVTESFPSYFLGRYPDSNIILTAYGSELAKKFARENKSKISNYGEPIFNIRVDPQHSTIQNFSLVDHSGNFISTGIGGAITGFGADLLIVDDPIKTRKEANSKTYRDSIWDEFNSTLRTRLSPDGAIIIVATRWHNDDLVGRLLKQEPDDWTVINLPCVALPDTPDLLNRQPGEPLWPSKFDIGWCMKQKQAVGQLAWESLYQQHPLSSSGTLVKRENLHYYTDLPSLEEMFISADLTFGSETQGNSFAVISAWGRDINDNFYLLDAVREKCNFNRTLVLLQQMFTKFPKAYTKLIENKAIGPSMISILQNKFPGITPITPSEGKYLRLQACLPQIESNHLYFPLNHPLSETFMDELSYFPNFETDDCLDVTTQVLNYYTARPTMRKATAVDRL